MDSAKTHAHTHTHTSKDRRQGVRCDCSSNHRRPRGSLANRRPTLDLRRRTLRDSGSFSGSGPNSPPPSTWGVLGRSPVWTTLPLVESTEEQRLPSGIGRACSPDRRRADESNGCVHATPPPRSSWLPLRITLPCRTGFRGGSKRLRRLGKLLVPRDGGKLLGTGRGAGPWSFCRQRFTLRSQGRATDLVRTRLPEWFLNATLSRRPP